MKKHMSILKTLVLLCVNTIVVMSQWNQIGLTTNKVMSIGVAPNGNIFAGTYTNGLYRSTNYGTDWTLVLGNMQGVYEVFSIAFDSSSGVLAGTYGSGLYRSTNDGDSWSSLCSDTPPDNLPIDDVYSIAVAPTGDIFAIDGASNIGDVYRSTDLGGTWQLSLHRSSGLLAVAVNSPNLVYAGGGDWFNYSTNSGTNWTWKGSSSGLTKMPLNFGVMGTKLFAGTSGDGVFLSTNNDVNWTAVNTGLTNKYINALAVCNGNLIAATSGGGVFLSTDDGANWSAINTGLTPTTIQSLAVDGSYLYAGTSNSGVWSRPLSEIGLPVELTSFSARVKGKNVELNWNTVTEVNNYGFEVEKKRMKDELGNMNWVKIGFIEGNGTTNSPKSYRFVDANVQEKVSYRLKQIDRDGKFEYSQEVEVVITQIPQEFALMQNYPNPFNPVTMINYQLPMNSYVSLSVYDIIGREVATLVNEQKEAGSYSVQFEGTKLSSGIYFYTLKAGNFMATKKLVLMK